MKRRIKLSTLLKRTILVALAVVVVSVVLVYFVDKYSPTKNSYINKYDDAYWNQEVLADFEYSADIYARVNKFNMNHADYVAPWELDNVDEGSLTLEQRAEYGRYSEEHFSIAKPITDVFEEYESQKKKFDAAKAWTELTSGNTVADWIYTRLDLEVEDVIAEVETPDSEGNTPLKDTADQFADVYEYVVDCTFDGTYEELVSIIQSSENYNGFTSAMKNASDKNNFTSSFDDYVFAYLLNKDVNLYSDVLEFDNDAYNTFMNDFNYYNELNTKVQERGQSLLQWKNYYPTTLLGFGGLATDYANKPALTLNTEDGNILELWFNMYTTSFKLVKTDKAGNVLQTWASNPESDPTANYQIAQNQKSILNVSYSILKGQTDVYSTYEYSVSETNIYNDKLTPTYAVSVDPENNKLTVWYHLEKRGVNYTYFPKYISATKMAEYLERNKQLAAEGAKTSTGAAIIDIESNVKLHTEFCKTDQSYYKLIPATITTAEGEVIENINNEFGFDYYELSGTHSSMSGIVRDTLYKCLYEYSGYTQDDLVADNSDFDYEINTADPSYEIAIEYTLNDNGLDVCIPGNSIKEDPKYPLTYVDILPYFTATANGVEGYTVIPDGSGAILNHTNGKNYSKYQKRVYSTDLTNTSYVNKGSNDDLMFPMYSVINPVETSGVIAYATSNAAQLQLTADIAGRGASEFGNFNVNYFTAFLRESKIITVGTHSYEKTQLTKWTDARVKDDISLSFHLLNKDQMSYSAAAKQYREILIDLYGLELNDKTNTPVLDMEVIGSYSYTENFVGIPYTAKGTLTTFDQLGEMINEFKELGIENINAYYLGWRNDGLKNASFEKIKISSKLGSKAKFEALLHNDDESVNVYPYVSFGEINKYQESFGKNHYTTHAVDGDVVWKQPYDLNSNVFDKTKSKIYILSPRYYVSFAERLAKSYAKVTDNYSAIAVDKLGSELSGDYRKGKETFKVDAVRNQITSLETLSNSGINNMTLYKPYDYAFKYVDIAKNIPYQTTQYEILDYSVPFYQLVINGLFDYSGESFNANSEKGTMEHLMRMIETGSNMSFTFSYESSEKLLPTHYNYYYYTMYTDWLETVKEVYGDLIELGIYDGELVAHEYVSSNIFKVTYNTAKGEVVIYLNYTRNNYITPNGITVNPKSYAVEQ